jgi:hypothetical protein
MFHAFLVSSLTGKIGPKMKQPEILKVPPHVSDTELPFAERVALSLDDYMHHLKLDHEANSFSHHAAETYRERVQEGRRVSTRNVPQDRLDEFERENAAIKRAEGESFVRGSIHIAGEFIAAKRYYDGVKNDTRLGKAVCNQVKKLIEAGEKGEELPKRVGSLPTEKLMTHLHIRGLFHPPVKPSEAMPL